MTDDGDDAEFYPGLRHGYDLTDHQHGHFRTTYAWASGVPAGTVMPAWVCCKCGGVEPTAFTLGINHSCGSHYSKCPSSSSKFELIEN